MSAPVYCDGHDALAVQEVSWVEAPGTRDERGQSTAVCEDVECLLRVLDFVAEHGEPVELLRC